LPVGGIKEKVMAAHRNNITNILLPKKNEQDFEDVPDDVRREITVKFIEDVTEALDYALEKQPDPDFFKHEILNFLRPKL